MGRRKLTKILLESGCDATLTNMQGETAMDIALKKSFKEVQEMIANPPPTRSRSSHDHSHPPLTTAKKREKESSLEGSKDSGRRSHKDRLKKVIISTISPFCLTSTHSTVGNAIPDSTIFSHHFSFLFSHQHNHETLSDISKIFSSLSTLYTQAE